MNFKMYQFERLEEKSFKLVHFKTLYLSPTHGLVFYLRRNQPIQNRCYNP